MFHKHVKIMFLRYGYKSISGVTRCQVFSGFCKFTEASSNQIPKKDAKKWICCGSKVWHDTRICLFKHLEVFDVFCLHSSPHQSGWKFHHDNIIDLAAINRLSIYWIVPQGRCTPPRLWWVEPDILCLEIPSSLQAPPSTAELDQVLQKRPDGRAKWLAKSLVQAPVGRRSFS